MRLTDDEIQQAKLRAMSNFIGQYDASQSALTVMPLSKWYGLAQDDEFSKRVMAEIKSVSHKSILSTVFDSLTLTDWSGGKRKLMGLLVSVLALWWYKFYTAHGDQNNRRGHRIAEKWLKSVENEFLKVII